MTKHNTNKDIKIDDFKIMGNKQGENMRQTNFFCRYNNNTNKIIV